MYTILTWNVLKFHRSAKRIRNLLFADFPSIESVRALFYFPSFICEIAPTKRIFVFVVLALSFKLLLLLFVVFENRKDREELLGHAVCLRMKLAKSSTLTFRIRRISLWMLNSCKLHRFVSNILFSRFIYVFLITEPAGEIYFILSYARTLLIRTSYILK